MIIQSKRVWIGEQFVPAQLEFKNQIITGIHTYGKMNVDQDYGEQRILPGFIDTHTHGGYGFDTNDANPEGLLEWLSKAPSEGITTITPTTITQSEEILTKALKNVANVYASNPKGAQIGGIHFEGPYLCVPFKGAQPEQYIVKPNLEQFKQYQKAANGLIKIISMATEEDDNFELTHYLAKNGVHVNIGHSAATYEQALDAFANGANGTTHTFNGMSAMNHRTPNLAGAALHESHIYGELICDCIHVAVPVMKIFYKCKDKDKSVLITDALAAKGIGEGRYIFGKQSIDIKANGAAYLADTTTLAGSTLRYNIGLKNVIEVAQVDIVSAINSTTTNPAHVLKLADRKGLIRVNYDADLVVLDNDYEVIETFVLGSSVYKK